MNPLIQNPSLAVIGLGYVGLPLAVEFGKKFKTIGFDLSQTKIDAYKRHIDSTGEVATEDLKAAIRADGLEPTTDPHRIASADFLIIAVPTPVADAHVPDFGPLIGASTIAGQHMKKGATVIFESTVYPGATEEVCIPVLEKHSGLKWKQDFHVGYSSERINPGDKEHTLVADLVANLQGFGLNVVVHDPLAGIVDAEHEYGISLNVWDDLPLEADAIVLAVAHRHYLQAPLADILAHLKPGGVFTGIKSDFDPQSVRRAGFISWRF